MGYILFSSPQSLSIMAKHVWNGIIEYSYDNNEWKEWNGEIIINNTIYMRGINNTVISRGAVWHIQGKNVKCQGNIENLLDYKSVINNIHPKMNDYCFSRMFQKCSSLIEAPQLLATKLSPYCYSFMFKDCQSLISIPTLPSSKTALGGYVHMFSGCALLIQSPLLMVQPQTYSTIVNKSLPYLSINNNCYRKMFFNTSLTISPMFSDMRIAKEVVVNQHMFDNCPIHFININNKLYDINVLKLI